LEDVRMQDRDEIKKIIRGEFKKKHEDLELEVEEDERKRKERMDEVMNWMKKREEDDGEGIYIKEPVEPE
jgi:proteasome lid subunit RPN8/RPN11